MKSMMKLRKKKQRNKTKTTKVVFFSSLFSMPDAFIVLY